MFRCLQSKEIKTFPYFQCEGVCQFGRQRRRLRCYTFKGNRVPNSKCNKSHKPQRKKKCISSHGCKLHQLIERNLALMLYDTH